MLAASFFNSIKLKYHFRLYMPVFCGDWCNNERGNIHQRCLVRGISIPFGCYPGLSDKKEQHGILRPTGWPSTKQFWIANRNTCGLFLQEFECSNTQALCHNSRWTQIKQTRMIVCRDIMWSYVMWHAIMPLGPNSMLPFGRPFRTMRWALGCFKILEGCLYPCISLLFTTGFLQSRCLTKWLPQHFPISLDKS